MPGTCLNSLTHWGRVLHICVSKLTIIASDNGLWPGRRQAIIWNNDGILLIWPLGTNFSEILIEIHSFSFRKRHLEMSSGKWRPFCFGPNALTLRDGSDLKSAISEQMLRIKLRLVQSTFHYKSSLVQVVARFHQVTSHYLSQCCPRSMSSYSSQWVKSIHYSFGIWKM